MGLDATAFATVASHLASFVLVFAIVSVLYTIVPYKRLHWLEVVPGALVAALLFEVGKTLFVLYLDNVGNLRAVYGSLTSVIVLMLWLYFSGRVLLFGVEVIAVRREGDA